MNKAAIYHRALSEYAFANSLSEIVIRLKVAVNDIKRVSLFYGDTAYQSALVRFSEIAMKKIASDSYNDYFEARIKNGYERIVYYFELHGQDEEKIYYYGDILEPELSKQRNDYFKFPFNRIEEIIDVPAWYTKATIYNVFLDSFNFSFNNKNQEIIVDGQIIRNKHGGSIKELTQKLNYIQNLGFNTIYLNPIFMAGEYHKYDTIDYLKIDPLFGTNEDFKTLVKEIHQRGMYIILDGVFNHSGWNFAPFLDCLEKQEKSLYKDWFYRLDFPIHKPEINERPPYSSFGYERLMPKINTSNPEVINYFVKVVSYWVKNYEIDGWRLDVADEVDRAFWREIRKAVKKANPEAVLIGEVWQTSSYFLDGTTFDTVMNYSFLRFVKAFFAKRSTSAAEFNYHVNQMLYRYREKTTYAQLNFLDSHDVPRFLSLVGGNIDILKLALVFLMTFVGVPCVFYGDEVGLTGISEEEYRRPIVTAQEDLRDFYQEVIKLRTNNECLISGKFQTIKAEAGNYLYHYERFNDKMRIGIILNNSPDPVTLPLSSPRILLSNHFAEKTLGGFGFIIYQK